MKIEVQSTERFVVHREADASFMDTPREMTVNQVVEALGKLPNGWHLVSMDNRPDGTTVFVVREPHKREIK